MIHRLLVLTALWGCALQEATLVGGAPPPGARPPKVAFVTYDAGETLGLLPVAPLLRSEGAEVLWVPLTAWSASLLENSGEPFLPLPESIHLFPHVLQRHNASHITYWREALARQSPDLAVLGMVSTVQGQVADALRATSVPTRGFHDGFQPPTSGAIAAAVAPSFDVIWVPTVLVGDGFRALGISAEVVGQPSLEAWRRAALEVDTAEVRRTQGVEPHQRIVTFAGQYGDDYEEILTSFLGAAATALVQDTTLILVLSPHPRTDGSVEREALQKAAAREGRPLTRVVPAAEGLNTMELTAASEALLTWTSTAGIQAAFMGKRVIYFSPPSDFHADLVLRGVALMADASSLPSNLAEALRSPVSQESVRRALLDAGYVMSADTLLARSILELLDPPHRNRREPDTAPFFQWSPLGSLAATRGSGRAAGEGWPPAPPR